MANTGEPPGESPSESLPPETSSPETSAPGSSMDPWVEALADPSSSRRHPLPPTPFPPVEEDAPDVVAAGGRPDPPTLLAAYARGIFPWPHQGFPLLWFCPDPRFILRPAALRVSRSLAKTLRNGPFEVRVDTAFEAVIRACALIPRPGQDGTWLTEDLIEGYEALHKLGFAHSVEAWREGRLVGGLCGLSLGRAFFGDSMFSAERDASKVCLATLTVNLERWDMPLVDCQSPTEHLGRLGAVEWPRRRFLDALEQLLAAPTRRGPWSFDLGPADAARRYRPAGGA